MKRPLLALALLVAPALSTTAHAAVIVGYNFNTLGATYRNPSSQAVNTLSTAITDGSVVTFQSGDYATPAMQVNPSTSATNEAGAISANTYFTFSVTVASGYALNLSTFTFDAARGGAGTPRSWHFYTDIGGFTLGNAVESEPVTTIRPNLSNYSVDLSGAAFQGITGTHAFRVYISTPTTNNSIEFDNLVLNGDVVAVPEPNAAAGVMVALVGLAVVRRRRGA